MSLATVSQSHFDRSALPPAKTFYERELGKLSRPSRGWARGCCPFHQSKSRMSFSVNLATGGFYCFGCNAKGGDAVDFVKLRDKVDFKRAAQLLGAWHDRDITPTEKREIRQQHRRPKPKEPPMSLDQILARKLAMAVEYGMEMPADASE